MLKYEIATKKFSELKGKIEIPQFQRGLVWGDGKRREFIKTLKSGLPIGVLLLAPTPKGDKYLIIDGLQRFSTMLRYTKNFFEYFTKEEITDRDLLAIIAASDEASKIFDGYREQVRQTQLDEMRDVLKTCIISGTGKNMGDISMAAAMELSKKIAAIPQGDTTKIFSPVFTIVDRVFSSANIDDIEIPLIIFTGPYEELVDIFQKLNQEGVKLSKYDVFAATWTDKYVQIKGDPTFIEHVINKYDAAQQKSGLEITDYDPEEMKKDGTLTVYEYAFAVGKALMEKCKKLFPKSDEEKVDAIGFLILAELVGLSYQKLGALADQICAYKSFDAKRFKDAILESAKTVEECLSPYIDSPTKTKGGKRTSLVCHSDLQLASYIIVVFKMKYDIMNDGALRPKAKSKEFMRVKDFLYKHYLYDILRGFWAGSGDSKLEALIADPMTCRYTRDVPKQDFENAIAEWLSGHNEKKKATNVSAEGKLFLNYILRTSGVYSDKIDYDVEHCVPKDALKNYIMKKGDITVPVSSVCNLVYIPAADNRSKGDLTYYQRKENDPSTYSLNQGQLDALGYPAEQDLDFVRATKTLTAANYYRFLNERKAVICHKIIEALYPK